MRCLECGAETAEAARFCARCGAPVIPQPSGADAAAGGPGDPAGLPNELVGQRAGHRSRRNAPIIIGAGLAALTAVIAAIAIAGSTSPSRSSASLSPPASSAPSTSPSRSSASPSPPASSAPSAGQLTRDELQPGDCLQLPNINTISQWPGVFPAVSCSQPHTGEVFFAGNIWPQSLAYPGDQPVNDQATARCDRAFTAYVGIPVDHSAYTYAWDMPDDGSWAIGDRSVQCIAYDPGGASMNVSIAGSKR
jgi:Septum formation/zinc-ribbon domain